MERFLSPIAQILRSLGTTTAVMTCTLLALAMPAHAGDTKPTAAEITKARAECAAQKQKVRGLESASADEELVSAARVIWVRACGHAQDLMNAASGISPPKPAPDPNAAAAAAPAPEAPPPQ